MFEGYISVLSCASVHDGHGETRPVVPDGCSGMHPTNRRGHVARNLLLWVQLYRVPELAPLIAYLLLISALTGSSPNFYSETKTLAAQDVMSFDRRAKLCCDRRLGE